jgi:lipopolysaccharide export system protein LptA
VIPPSDWYNQRVSRRTLRALVLIFGIGIAGAIAYGLRPRAARPVPAALERLDPKAIIETLGCDAVQLKGSIRDVRVECTSQVTYDDGQTALRDVKIHVDNRGGRAFDVKAAEARLGTGRSTYDLSGGVEMTASDGLTATTDRASFSEAERVVQAPGPVDFHRDRLSGSGIGFTFDDTRNTVWLLDQALVRLDGDDGAGPALDVAAGAAGLARTERYFRFERTVRMEREGQVIEADTATVYLLPDRDEPHVIELRGHSRISGGSGMGALRSLQANDINLTYGDDGRTLQAASLNGQAVAVLDAADDTAGQTLAGNTIDVQMGADGGIAALTANERVTVSLPATGQAPLRTIRAQKLTGSGAPGMGLSAMRFQEAVEFREAPAQGRGARVARARTLVATLDGAGQSLEEAQFTGGFLFEDGALRAQSADATYGLAAGTLALRGTSGGASPAVSDEALRIDAESIDITLSPRKMSARGRVRTTLQPSRGRQSAGRRPGLLTEGDAVNVLASDLSYDERTRTTIFRGAARMLQGTTVIQADTITLDEARGDLIAAGGVTTSLGIGTTDGTAGKPTLGRADAFRYTDESRRALYDARAQFNSDAGDLQASRIELLLAGDDNQLERLDAQGAVQVTLGARRATGTRLVYRPAEARYEITGTPGRFTDACNESSGRTLTFFRSSDRVIIDGNEQSRTETRGGKCPGTAPF